MRSAALFCSVGAAALFACFFPQFAQFLAEWGELLFVGGAQIGDALFAVGLLTADVGSGGITFHGDGGKLGAERTDIVPQFLTIGTRLVGQKPERISLTLLGAVTDALDCTIEELCEFKVVAVTSKKAVGTTREPIDLAAVGRPRRARVHRAE